MNPLTRHYRGRMCMFLLHGALVTSSFLAPVTCCRTAIGAEIKLTPACEFKEEYNDNVFLATGNRRSDFITTLTPSLTFSSASERLNIDLVTGFSWHDYARTPAIGKLDYLYNAQMTNRLTPLYDVGLTAGYVRNTRPDSINQTTGLTTNSGTDRQQYSATVKRLLDETKSATLGYSFFQNTYDNSAYQANRVHNASLVFSKDFSAILPRLNGTVGTNYSRAIYRDSSSDNYSLTVGASRNINEKLYLALSVGGQFVHSNFVTNTETNNIVTTSEMSNDSWGAVGTISLNYTGEKTFGSLSFVRGNSAASGQVSQVETTMFGLSLGRKLSDRTVAHLMASYNINHASSGQFSSQAVDDRALTLQADIVYPISQFFDIGLQYNYYSVTYALNDSHASQNSVMLRAVAKYPIKR